MIPPKKNTKGGEMREQLDGGIEWVRCREGRGCKDWVEVLEGEEEGECGAAGWGNGGKGRMNGGFSAEAGGTWMCAEGIREWPKGERTGARRIGWEIETEEEMESRRDG